MQLDWILRLKVELDSNPALLLWWFSGTFPENFQRFHPVPIPIPTHPTCPWNFKSFSSVMCFPRIYHVTRDPKPWEVVLLWLLCWTFQFQWRILYLCNSVSWICFLCVICLFSLMSVMTYATCCSYIRIRHIATMDTSIPIMFYNLWLNQYYFRKYSNSSLKRHDR